MTRASALLPSDFVTGSLIYADEYPGQEDTSLRLVIPVTLDGKFKIKAIIDTGTPWCIFDPDLLSLLGIVPQAEGETVGLWIRGVRYTGQLVRLMIRLEAYTGNNLDTEATVFVPELEFDNVWQLPNFIGLERLLNRVRFAVDPGHNTFYFGEI